MMVLFIYEDSHSKKGTALCVVDSNVSHSYLVLIKKLILKSPLEKLK